MLSYWAVGQALTWCNCLTAGIRVFNLSKCQIECNQIKHRFFCVNQIVFHLSACCSPDHWCQHTQTEHVLALKIKSPSSESSDFLALFWHSSNSQNFVVGGSDKGQNITSASIVSGLSGLVAHMQVFLAAVSLLCRMFLEVTCGLLQCICCTCVKDLLLSSFSLCIHLVMNDVCCLFQQQRLLSLVWNASSRCWRHISDIVLNNTTDDVCICWLLINIKLCLRWCD